MYHPQTGSARVKRGGGGGGGLVADERRYIRDLDRTAVSGEIELFYQYNK